MPSRALSESDVSPGNQPEQTDITKERHVRLRIASPGSPPPRSSRAALGLAAVATRRRTAGAISSSDDAFLSDISSEGISATTTRRPRSTPPTMCAFALDDGADPGGPRPRRSLRQHRPDHRPGRRVRRRRRWTTTAPSTAATSNRHPPARGGPDCGGGAPAAPTHRRARQFPRGMFLSIAAQRKDGHVDRRKEPSFRRRRRDDEVREAGSPRGLGLPGDGARSRAPRRWRTPASTTTRSSRRYVGYVLRRVDVGPAGASTSSA